MDQEARGQKRPADGIVLTNKKAALPLDPDSDFDDDPSEAPKPRPKPKPPKPATNPKPAKISRSPRLQFAGQRTADKCIMHARDNGPKARVIVVTLDWRKSDYDEAHEIVCAKDCTGRYNYALDDKQTALSADEFLGLFYTDAAGDPGVGKIIAEMLLESEDNHVVVVDGTPKGEEFARLAALVTAHFYKLLPGGNGELYKAARKFPTRAGKPAFPVWQAVVNRMNRCKSEILLRAAMKDHYDDHLADLL